MKITALSPAEGCGVGSGTIACNIAFSLAECLAETDLAAELEALERSPVGSGDTAEIVSIIGILLIPGEFNRIGSITDISIETCTETRNHTLVTEYSIKRLVAER